MTKNTRKWLITLIAIIGIFVALLFYYDWNDKSLEKSTKLNQITLFKSSTEQETTGFVAPDNDLVSTLVRELPDVAKSLQFCIDKSKGSAKNYKDFLMAYPVIEREGKYLYFLRPALEPYCSPLYGAHSFQFWFLHRHTVNNVPKYHVVLAQSADSAAVLDSIHNGKNDIMSEYCVAAGCDVWIFNFNGTKYVQAQKYFEKSDMPDQ